MHYCNLKTVLPGQSAGPPIFAAHNIAYRSATELVVEADHGSSYGSRLRT
jgi:hypothetical protein